MLGQAAAGQWSSTTVDIYDWTTRGPLEAVAAHVEVQWFATRRRVEATRAMPAWASRGLRGAEDA